MTKTTQYYIEEHGRYLQDMPDLDPVDNSLDLAEALAKWYWDRRNGWGCNWPLTFVIVEGNHEERFKVDMWLSPNFHASKSE